MLLYAVAAMRVEPTGNPGWFGRCANAHPVVISISEDVLDIVLRLPQAWNVIEDARLHGVHDDEDIMEGDVRFSGGFDGSVFSIVRCDGQGRFVALMQVNAAEAAFCERRLYTQRTDFEHCLI